MNREGLRRRAKALEVELEEATQAYEDGRLETKHFKGIVQRIHDESCELECAKKQLGQVAKFAGATDADTGGTYPGMPGAINKGLMNPYLQSPMQATPQQIQQLEYAMRAKTPCTIEIEQKGWQAGMGFKAAGPMEESGYSPALPGVELPNKYMSYPYEPTRLASYLPGAAMDRASAFWISETAHNAEAAATAENASKPDLNPTLVNNEVTPTKVAGLFSYTFEIELDTPGGVSGFILNSLQRSIINAENDLLLNADAGVNSATFDGWLNQSGTLSQDGASFNGVDAIITAAAAMRSNSGSFAQPDLLIVSPNTVAAILMEKSSIGTYLNDVVYGGGPGGLTWNGDSASALTTAELRGGVTPQGHQGGSLHLAGVPVVQTTQIADFTGVLLSIRNGGGVYWTRQNMFVMYDPYSGLATNTYRYVAEERIALSVPRPAAVSVITNLAGTSA